MTASRVGSRLTDEPSSLFCADRSALWKGQGEVVRTEDAVIRLGTRTGPQSPAQVRLTVCIMVRINACLSMIGYCMSPSTTEVKRINLFNVNTVRDIVN